MGNPVTTIAWRDVLRRFDIQPKKSLGQNFIFDSAILDRIVAAGEVGPGDIVLEIGPGAGSLTRALAQAAARVVAVELDNRLMPVLAHTTADLSNITLVHGDILQVNLHALRLFSNSPTTNHQPPTTSSYKVVANIPYYITGPIIRRLLEAPIQPALIVLTLQREVAERICAVPPEMSLLAVSVQFYGQPCIVGHIPADAFYPSPEVDSAILRIDLFERPALTSDETDKFFEVVKAGFSQKRKQIKNALSSGLKLSGVEVERWLTAAGIASSRRAETVTLAEWVRLSLAS